MTPVHVSIHDVSPVSVPEVERALAMCHSFGARPALLVVPNFHGAAPILQAPEFCHWLRSLQTAGHEIYLHGYFHLSRPGGKGLSRFLAQKVVSAGEAELSDVTPAEAAERLDRGLEELRRAGLTVDGFVPPAWSMPRWVLPLLAERGIRYCEDHLRVYDPAAGIARWSLVLNYASRSPWRLLSTVVFCRLARYARPLLPTRIAIHPADMRFPLLAHELEGLLRWTQGGFARGADLIHRAAT